MGYSSEVAYLIEGSKEDIISFITKVRLLGGPASEALKEVTVGAYDEGDLYIAFEARGVKWYPDFDDVKSHEELWNLAEDETNEDGLQAFSGAFCRVGEDTNDLEERNFGDDVPYDRVYITRGVGADVNIGDEHDIRKTLGVE
jgi:hypothetical protein